MVEQEGHTKELDKANYSLGTFLKTTFVALIIVIGISAFAKTLSEPTSDEKDYFYYDKNLVRNKAGVLRIEAEINGARELLLQTNAERFLESPYVVSTLYYSDDFLRKLSPKKKEGDSTRITLAIRNMLTPEIRKRYLVVLEAITKRGLSGKTMKAGPLVRPFEKIDFGSDLSHADALDMFVSEGTSVHALQSGLIVLAEGEWSPADPFSTSSMKCGNTVIMYNAPTGQFSRYCHLEKVLVSVGDVVFSGDVIGVVGNSGLNASLKGHGDHLHFEINHYNKLEGKMLPFTRQQLKELISAIP